MLEILFCSLFTILPDYLYRHFAQGKRIGQEITLFSVWYELRWGISGCIILAISLITVIFYNHPGTNNVTAFFRTVPIVPEINGRVSEVFVGLSADVKQGQPIFKLDSSKQEAALEVAKRRIAEIDAQIVMAQSEVAVSDGQIQQAQAGFENARDELETKQELNQRQSGIVAAREIERLQQELENRKGALAAATASREAAQTRLTTLLPASKASAEAALQQAQVDLDKMTIYAGVDGRIEQFTLRVGDYVNPFMRPAGALVPAGAGRRALVAGFNQIEAQVLKVGMTAEVTCISKPWVIIPMVITSIQDYIAAGQVRMSDRLRDAQNVTQPGTITVFMEPLHEGGLDGLIPGSSCTANAYTNNHEYLHREDIGLGAYLYAHIVDTVSIVHAAGLRIRALLLPIQTLVLGGH